MMKLLVVLALFCLKLQAAVILLYHHVDTNTPYLTSVTPKVFEQHLQYLYENEYKVYTLKEIAQFIQKKKAMPKKAVAISFDDAYASIYTKAWPLLKKYNYPFTIFVNTAPVDNQGELYLTWDQLRQMSKQGASIESHSHRHAFLIRQTKEQIKEDISISLKRLEEELGYESSLFAYPFGEYTQSLQEVLKEFGLIGFAQKSAPVGLSDDLLSLSRFPMMGHYAKMDRFSLIINTQAFNILEDRVEKRVLNTQELLSHKVTFALKDFNAKALNCFSSDGQSMPVKKEIKANKLELFFKTRINKIGRFKVNCTAPSLSKKGVFYWYSNLWMIKDKERWYDF